MPPGEPPSTGLPIEDVIEPLRMALADPGIAVLEAEPGAGKTTVVPLRLLHETWLGEGTILMLEPRRLATRAAAARMASLLGQKVGQTVGYRTRGDSKVARDTRIEVVTEGILTRRIQNDPELSGVGLVIFDEFHERSIQAELGLAFALDSRDSIRPDLRLLVMSATIEGSRVASLLDDEQPAPIVRSTGRQFPVDIRWQPRKRTDHLEPAVASAVKDLLRTEPAGDILAFLPGTAAIRRTSDLLRSSVGPDVDVRPLFGALPADEQDAAIRAAAPGRRKVVVSTDIAETSLTVDGVTMVVDGGLVRTPQLDARTGMTALTTVSNSRASADQRAGRAGRTAPGIAVRLWSKIEHGTRPAHTAAEIMQIDLAGLVLETAGWGVANPAELRFLDAPPDRALDSARELLVSLGALGGDGRITAHGRNMVHLPLHPRLAHLVLVAQEQGHGWLGCMIAALLEDRDVLRGRPDEVAVDLDDRLALLVDPNRRHPQADGRGIRAARDRAKDIARRLNISQQKMPFDASGMLLALAYPDRVARKRDGASGKYLLRSGTGAWMAPTDGLANQTYLVAAHLDADRRESRIRLAAALDADDLARSLADEVEETEMVLWDTDRNDLTLRVERRVGAVRLTGFNRRPYPGPGTVAALLDRVRDRGLDMLGWSKKTSQLRARIGFLHRSDPAAWPDTSDAGLLETLEDWLGPHLADATGRKDLESVDLRHALMGVVGWHNERELNLQAPASWTLASGRELRIDYSGEQPLISSRAQDFYGITVHPAIANGKLPLVVQLLSPAQRPIQITADLPGFWQSSWADVRKDMAGRYPKHPWPDDPSQA